MLENNIMDFSEVAKIINAYYKDKDSVLKYFGIA